MAKRDVWQDTLAMTGKEGGYYRPLGAEHNALFLRGDSTLVVTFDNLDDARQDVKERMPWGSQFISSRGWSSLGIGAHGWTWYRDEAVLNFFDELQRDNFFDQFDNVVFYGTSMAGYAATVFCSAAPGSKVIAMNPQATLDRKVTTGWETRFRKSWRRDFNGRYSYGPDQAATARAVYLFYDPKEQQDAMHAALYQADNTIKIKCRNYGHGLATMFSQMGVLKTIVETCVNDTPAAPDIYRILTARKRTPRYQKAVLNALKEKNRPKLIHQYCEAVLHHSGDNNRPHFRNAMDQAAKSLGADKR